MELKVSEGDYLQVKIIKSNNVILHNKVVIVPLKYISTGSKPDEYNVKYLNPPYSDDDVELMKDFFVKNADPPPTWDSHQCMIMNKFDCYQEDENLVATKFNAKDDSENVPPNAAQFQRPFSITKNEQQNFVNVLLLDSSLSNVASEDIDSIPEISKKNCVESGLKEMLRDLCSTLTADIKKEVKASTNEILKKLNDIDVKQSELYLRVQNLESKLEEILNTKIVENFVTLQNISDKYKIQFPFTENNNFQTFNDRLKDDVDLQADLDKFIKYNMIMQKTMSNNLTDIFKQMFTKCVLTQYTAQIATDAKPAMCNTTFFKCVQEAILSKYNQSNQQIDVKNIKQALGQIINNAYDWEGGRLERALKRKKKCL